MPAWIIFMLFLYNAQNRKKRILEPCTNTIASFTSYSSLFAALFALLESFILLLVYFRKYKCTARSISASFGALILSDIRIILLPMVVQSTKHKAYYSIRIEGMSNSIKVLKRVTYDMPHFRSFRARILHCCSKVVP